MTCVVFLHREFLIVVISIVCEVYHSLCSGVLLPRFELGEKMLGSLIGVTHRT